MASLIRVLNHKSYIKFSAKVSSHERKSNCNNENIYISPLLDEHKSQPPMISRFPTKNAVLNCFYLMMKTIKTQEIPFES